MPKPRTAFVIWPTIACILPVIAVAQQTPASAPAKTQHTTTSTARKTTSTTHAATKPKPLVLTTDKDKISYALGMNMAKGLQRQSVEVNPDVLVRGLKDSLTGGKTLLTDAEAQTALTSLQTNLRAKQEEKAQQLAQDNKKEGTDFLA